jgi:transcriptional regulator with XRE-family HTH domain
VNLINEKEAFSRRLAQLLNNAGIGIASPTHVEREFNRRYLGKPVSTQAVRKWLNGEAIPSSDKIRALAKWLKASPHGLHYGEDEKSVGMLGIEEERSRYGESAIATLPEDFQRLTPQHKTMVCEIVHALLRLEKQ